MNKSSMPLSTGDQLKENSPSRHNTNFIFKAFAIVNVTILVTQDPTYLDIIHWSESGTSFIIENIQQFELYVLPDNFRHNRYQSFVRQLNMYDFHKIRNGDHYSENKAQFKHQGFFRGGQSELSQIKRKGFKQKEIESHKINTKAKKYGKKKNIKKQKAVNRFAPSQTSIRRPIKYTKVVKNVLKNRKKNPSSSSIIEEFHSDSENSQQQKLSFFNEDDRDESASILQQCEKLEKEKQRRQCENFIEKVTNEFMNSKIVEDIQKLPERIKLAETIKQKWHECFSARMDILQDVESMKFVYEEIKKKISEKQEKIKMGEESQEREKQAALVLTDLGEQDFLIDSIFKKAEIRSTLIYINSETFINPNLVNHRTFFGI